MKRTFNAALADKENIISSNTPLQSPLKTPAHQSVDVDNESVLSTGDLFIFSPSTLSVFPLSEEADVHGYGYDWGSAFATPETNNIANALFPFTPGAIHSGAWQPITPTASSVASNSTGSVNLAGDFEEAINFIQENGTASPVTVVPQQAWVFTTPVQERIIHTPGAPVINSARFREFSPFSISFSPVPAPVPSSSVNGQENIADSFMTPVKRQRTDDKGLGR